MNGSKLSSAKPRSAQHHSMERRVRCIQHGSVSFDPDVDAYVACFQYTMLANVISSGDSEMTCLASFATALLGSIQNLGSSSGICRSNPLQRSRYGDAFWRRFGKDFLQTAVASYVVTIARR